MKQTALFKLETLYTRITGAYHESARGELLCEAVLNMDLTEGERERVSSALEQLKSISTDCRELQKAVSIIIASGSRKGGQ